MKTDCSNRDIKCNECIRFNQYKEQNGKYKGQKSQKKIIE